MLNYAALENMNIYNHGHCVSLIYICVSYAKVSEYCGDFFRSGMFRIFFIRVDE